MTIKGIVNEIESTSNSKADLIVLKNKLERLWTALYKKEKYTEIEPSLQDKIDLLTNKGFYYIDKKPVVEQIELSYEQLTSFSNKMLTDKEIELILKHIVFKTRKFLNDINRESIIDLPLTGFCIDASSFIQYSFSKYFPIYTLQAQNIFSPMIGHHFTVIYFLTADDIKPYIIDTTYRQFCLLSKCNKHRINHYENSVSPGYFISDIGIIEELLEKGYIEINEHNSKVYGDSFFLANQSTEGIITSSTDISSKKYVHSLIYGNKVWEQ